MKKSMMNNIMTTQNMKIELILNRRMRVILQWKMKQALTENEEDLTEDAGEGGRHMSHGAGTGIRESLTL